MQKLQRSLQENDVITERKVYLFLVKLRKFNKRITILRKNSKEEFFETFGSRLEYAQYLIQMNGNVRIITQVLSFSVFVDVEAPF